MSHRNQRVADQTDFSPSRIGRVYDEPIRVFGRRGRQVVRNRPQAQADGKVIDKDVYDRAKDLYMEAF